MAANLDLFHIHLHRKPNANTKLDLRPPIVDRDNFTLDGIHFSFNMYNTLNLRNKPANNFN